LSKYLRHSTTTNLRLPIADYRSLITNYSPFPFRATTVPQSKIKNRKSKIPRSMSAILPTLALDSDDKLRKHFMPHQAHWIQAEDPLHSQGKQVFAFAEKSVRIGWTHADGFKNVRKRLMFKKRDYLFATKDWPSALEYMNQVYEFADVFNLTGSIVSHGEDSIKVPCLDSHGAKTGFTEHIKIGTIKFDNGSRIIAFSSNPHAMAVYGGDVGLDEFAKHPNAELLWKNAQGRVALGHDAAVWSSHDGEDIVALRRGDLVSRRISLEELRLAAAQAKSDKEMEALFWAWTKRPDIQSKLYPHRDPDKVRRDVVRMLDRELLGRTHHDDEPEPEPACYI
jgi:hypothetical protein